MYAINSTEAPVAQGPYSQGSAAGRLVFVSGQIGIDPTTQEFVADSTKEQAKAAIQNIALVLKATALSLEDVAKITVFVTNIEDKADIDDIFEELFSKPRPARSMVEVSALPRGAHVEIEAIAVR